MSYKKIVIGLFLFGLAMSSQIRAFEIPKIENVVLNEVQTAQTSVPKLEKCSCSKKKKKHRS